MITGSFPSSVMDMQYPPSALLKVQTFFPFVVVQFDVVVKDEEEEDEDDDEPPKKPNIHSKTKNTTKPMSPRCTHFFMLSLICSLLCKAIKIYKLQFQNIANLVSVHHVLFQKAPNESPVLHDPGSDNPFRNGVRTPQQGLLETVTTVKPEHALQLRG